MLLNNKFIVLFLVSVTVNNSISFSDVIINNKKVSDYSEYPVNNVTSIQNLNKKNLSSNFLLTKNNLTNLNYIKEINKNVKSNTGAPYRLTNEKIQLFIQRSKDKANKNTKQESTTEIMIKKDELFKKPKLKKIKRKQSVEKLLTTIQPPTKSTNVNINGILKNYDILKKYFSLNCTIANKKPLTTTPLTPTNTISQYNNPNYSHYATNSWLLPTGAWYYPPQQIQKPKTHKTVYVDPPGLKVVADTFEGIYDAIEDVFTTKVKVPLKKSNQSSYGHFPVVFDQNGYFVPVSQTKSSFLTTQNYMSQSTKALLNTKNISQSKKNLSNINRLGLSASQERTNSKMLKLDYSDETTSKETTTSFPHSTIPMTTISKQLSPIVSKVTSIGNMNNKNFLTTKIHVTSEYGEFVSSPAPQTTTVKLPKQSSNENSDDEEYDDEYYDDFNMNLYDDGEEDYAIKKSKYRNHLRKKYKIKRKEEYNEDDYYYKSDQDDSDDQNYFGYFGNFFNTIANYISSLTGFGKNDDYHTDEGRSTTPKFDYRKPKHPKNNNYEKFHSSQALDSNQNLPIPTIEEKQWYNPFNTFEALDQPVEEELTSIPLVSPVTIQPGLFDSWFNEDTTNAPDITTISTTSETSGWIDSWFSSDDSTNNEVVTSTQVVSSTTTEATGGWFFGIFDDEPTKNPALTTTPRATAENTLPAPFNDPLQLIAIIAQNLVTTTKKPLLMMENIANGIKRVNYNKYQLWRLFPTRKKHVEFLSDYRVSPEGVELQWWRGPSHKGPTDVLVPPNKIKIFKEFLDDEDIRFETTVYDMQKVIQYENPRITKREKVELELTQGHPMSWNRYHKYEDMMKFFNFLQRKYPKLVNVIHIGRSYEGRPLVIIKVSSKKPLIVANTKKKPVFQLKKKKIKKPSVFIESGSHGREWISPASSTWILNKVIKQIDLNDTQGELLRSVDWYFMPVLNPDGYEYSHNYDRFWRKTRSNYREQTNNNLISMALNWFQLQQYPSKDYEKCIGADLNLNWDYMWSEMGASRYPCSEAYSGSGAFSEPEARELSKFLIQHRKDIKIFVSLHSYGQIISYSKLQNSSTYSSKIDDMYEMAAVAVESLRSASNDDERTRYIIDKKNEMLYPRSGSSDYYAFHNVNIPYSYKIELSDTGTHGYLLPPFYIGKTSQDAFDMIKAMIDYL